MKYKVLINRCEDSQRAAAVAAEIARWSGSTPEVVYNAVTQKAVCIRKEADEDEARRLCAQFSAAGASIELVPIQDAPAASFAAAPAGFAAAVPLAAAAPDTSTGAYDCSGDEEEPGRILTDAEYADMAKSRPDVFYFEKSGRMRNIQSVCMILAIASIFLISRHVPAAVASTDFFEKKVVETAATIGEIDARLQEQLDKQKKEVQKKEVPSEVKSLTPKKNANAASSGSGGGDPRERIVRMGVLGIVSGDIKGKTVADADVFGKGGFASGIDAILSGVGGLKPGADGGVGRMGARGIGFGEGNNSGFGGNGIDGLLSGLMGPAGGGIELVRRSELKVQGPSGQTGSSISGGRSRISIQRVVMQNMAALRHAYSRRLKDKPGLNGTVTVKFSIDEFGKVIFAQMTASTLSDAELETAVVTRVRSWVFDKIDKPGDVTEVTYPFTFTQ